MSHSPMTENQRADARAAHASAGGGEEARRTIRFLPSSGSRTKRGETGFSQAPGLMSDVGVLGGEQKVLLGLFELG